MNKVRPINLRAMLVVLPVLLMVGCSSHAVKKPQPPSYSQLMQQAQTSQAADEMEKAKSLYRQAADADPTRAAPWYQLARIDFNRQEYGRSITSAREALKRNPTDTKAQSLLTVSGLRVAIQALGSLRDETDPQGPAHQVALQLVQKMRTVLGEDVLVPQASGNQTASRHRSGRRKSRRHVVVHKLTPEKPAKPTKPVEAKPEKTYSNPFQALPGNGRN